MLNTIAFDADDTLWHTESLFVDIQEQFKELLAHYHSPEWIDQRLLAVEKRNLEYFGYGVKGFTLSMIETAIELTEGRIEGHEIQKIIDFAKAMLTSPVEVLDGVEKTILTLKKTYSLMIITKGDLFDQESKIARSGLADHFTHIEIVSEKTSEVYRAILEKYQIPPEQFLMVGNSMKSDILPVLAIGGKGVHIPYQITWEHEKVSETEKAQAEYFQLGNIGELTGFVEKLVVREE